MGNIISFVLFKNNWKEKKGILKKINEICILERVKGYKKGCMKSNESK